MNVDILKYKIWHPEKSVILTDHIGEGTIIHAPVWIGKDVWIGKNCKIQAFAFIPEGVVIQDNVFIGPHVCFTNDKNPPSGRNNWEKTLVCIGAVIGANSTILPGLTIGEFSKVGAGSVLTKNVGKNELWYGNSAKKHNIHTLT